MDGMVETLAALESLNAKARALEWPGEFERAGAFDRPELNRLLSLWRDKAENDRASRANLDFHALKEVLPHVWIVERVIEGGRARYRCRLMGTEVARVAGDLTGRFFDEAVAPNLVPRWIAVCDAIFASREPIRAFLRVDLPAANFLDCEMFLVPFAGEDGEPSSEALVVSYFRPSSNRW
jgi:hypothetical protein